MTSLRKTAIVFLPALMVLVALICLECTNDYNPFSDAANSKIVIANSTFDSGDTVSLFGVDTLKLKIAAAENVDSVTVACAANRYWSDTCLSANLTLKTFSFLFSLYDTGWQEIRITNYRAGKEAVTTRLQVYVVSLLGQATIAGQYEQPIALHTNAVVAEDALYCWDFGRGVLVKSPYADTSVSIDKASLSDTGYLWVEDVKGGHESPKYPFVYALNDDIGPTIVCVNQNFVNKDTIVSGDLTLALRFSITDRGLSTVYKAMVDSGDFDYLESGIYVTMLERLDTLTGYLSVLVTAVDNAYYQNVTEKTFYITYDSTVASTRDGYELLMLVPPSDSLVFNTRQRQINGLFRNYTGNYNTFSIRVAVNDSPYTVAAALSGAQRSFEWGDVINLASDVNHVWVAAYDSSGARVADTAMTFFYDADQVDSMPPVIVSMQSGDQNLDRLYIDTTRVPVRVVAFDEGSGIASVTLDGVALEPEDSSGYFWIDTIDVEHNSNGTTVVVLVTDKSGITTTQRATIFHNNTPQIQVYPTPPLPLFVDSAYTDTFRISDKDWSDTLSVALKSGPEEFWVDNLGTMYWKPTSEDVGTHTIVLLYDDGVIPEPLRYTYTIEVAVASDFSLPQFTTTEQDFPAYAISGDTMEIVLEVSVGRGNPPYTFSATVENGITLPSVSNDTLRWVPGVADTGYTRLNVIVTDYYKGKDTLTPIILVVPENQPCSLSVSHSLDTTETGALDLAWKTEPETLSYTIYDEDHPTAEKHVVNVAFSGTATVGSVDSSGQFIVVVDPLVVSVVEDTLVVTVTDKGGHSYSINTRLYFGLPYKYVQITTGTGGANIASDLVAFPVLVRLNSSNFDFSKAQSNGEDIRFEKMNGVPLPYEVDRWDKAAQVAEIWVLVDTVYANNDSQQVRMSYGNVHAVDSSDAESVFDTANGFAGVWHLSEKTGTNRYDATAYGHTGTAVNYAANDWTEGVIGICDSSHDTTSYITMGNPQGLRIQGPITGSAWVYGYQPTQKILSKHDWGSSNKSSWSLYFETFGGDNPIVELSYDGVTEKFFQMTTIAADLNAWNYITFSFDPSTQVVTVSVNGAFEQQPTGWSNGTVLYDTETDFILRANRANDEIKNVLRLAIDEARVANVVRSADWLTMCYETQRPGSNVVTVASP